MTDLWWWTDEKIIETITLMTLGPPVSLVKRPKPKVGSIKGKPLRKADPVSARAWRLKRYYGLTLDDFAELLASQDGGCAGCGTTDQLVIDHDHSCCPGKVTCGECVRGILCNRCNQTLGYAQDDPDRLSKLVSYLGGRSIFEQASV